MDFSSAPPFSPFTTSEFFSFLVPSRIHLVPVISRAFVDACISVYHHDRPPADFLSDLKAIKSSSRPSVAELEAMYYYAGLPSSPKLVSRTGPIQWKPPTGPEAYNVMRELRPVFNHKIIPVWNVLADKVLEYLDSLKVRWSSIDGVRFAEVGEAPGPVVLWIGVTPKSLSGEDAHTAAFGCLDILKEFDITDVDVEFRESVYTRSVGPRLLKRVFDFHPTVDVRGPLTPVLGLQIAAARTPFVEGTGGLYFSEGGDSNKVFLITARHVVFPPNEVPNNNYARTNKRRHQVLLLGSKAFEKFFRSIKSSIGGHAIEIEIYERHLAELTEEGVENDDAADESQRSFIQEKVDKAKAKMNPLDEFHDEVAKYWSDASQRLLGHVVCSPPIALGVGTERYTEDYAIIELDSSKIDKSAFKGNVIDLRTF